MTIGRHSRRKRRPEPAGPERARGISGGNRARSIARVFAFMIAFTTACTQEAAAPIRSYDAPLRTDRELAAELRALCEAAGGGGGAGPATDGIRSETARPVLVEFSAAWCSDCQRLNEMKQAGPLARELSEWPHTTVNVGRFDRHRDVLDAMGIESIAHWAVLAPSDCSQPIDRWKRLADRTLEVSSGEARRLTPADLAAWLRGLRTS